MSRAAVARPLATKKARLFQSAISTAACCFVFMLSTSNCVASSAPGVNDTHNVDDDVGEIEPTTPLPTATPLGSPGDDSNKFYYEYTRPAADGESFLKSSRRPRMEDETFTRQYTVGSDGADGMVFATGSCALQVIHPAKEKKFTSFSFRIIDSKWYTIR